MKISHANSIALLAEIFVQNEVGIIVTEHSYFSMAQNKTPFLKRVIMKFLVKILYKRAKAVIVVSRKAANNLTRKIGVRKDSLHVIYNPIDIESISEKSKEEPQHDWLNNKKYPVILGAGRLTMPKDFSTLIKAFNCLRKKRRAKLIILGEGGKRKELEKLIRELNLQSDVDMPGFVSNPYSYMSKSDVFVLSSKYEGFGNVLVEAMACGVSVVSTNCPGGPAEILENGKYGKLVSVGDVNALAMVILETLNNSTEKEVLKERARFFSLEKAVNKYLELINE
jgi:glycosyltransferase involved in cell wall biosynthesis